MACCACLRSLVLMQAMCACQHDNLHEFMVFIIVFMLNTPQQVCLKAGSRV